MRSAGRRAAVRAVVVVLTLAALGASGGCTLQAPGTAMVESRLFLGRARPDGTTVDEASWDAFLAEVVTPRFPDGLTVLDAHGQWRDPDGATIVREPTKVLIVVRPRGVSADAAVDAIAAEWKRRFMQKSVLRVDVPVRAAF
jgi:hypothetical protein